MKKTRQVHGLADVKMATMMNSDDQLQRVLVTDGADGTVMLSLSSSSYPAILSANDAHEIARLLIESVERESSGEVAA